MKKVPGWMLFLGGAVLLTGCSQQTINSAQHDAQHDAAVVNHEANKAVQEAKPQLKKADLGARVTAALGVANIHGVRVDAAPDGVTLVGHTASQADKARAVQIAQDTLGPGKAVRSRIVVSP